MKKFTVIYILMFISFLLLGCSHSKTIDTSIEASNTNIQDVQEGSILLESAINENAWKDTALPIKEEWESTGRRYASFTASLTGFILVSSEPALGQMNRCIYKTSDGGKHWLRIANITEYIHGYTTGMKFINDKIGWITCSNHGQDYIPAFKTTDGGKTWSRENLHMIDSYKDCYANSYAPEFWGEFGVLPVEYVTNGRRFVVPYITTDGGETWKAHELK